MSHSCREEADSLTQHHSIYCFLKENLQAHCLCQNDRIKFLYFCPAQGTIVLLFSYPEQAAVERKVLYSFNLTVT